MKKMIVSMLFLLSACSSSPQTGEELYITRTTGQWRLAQGGETFLQNLTPPLISAPEGTIVTIANGSFTIGGQTFFYRQIDMTGVLALYQFERNGATLYFGLGFNRDGALLVTDRFTSLEGVIIPATAQIFMTR